MSANHWDSKFACNDYVYGTAPNAHLVAQAATLPAGGRVLLPGDGEGRNGVWLARQGFAVTSVDASAVGLDKAHKLAASHGVAITTEQADLRHWSWPTAAFDAVVSIFIHFPAAERPAIHARMAGTLRPGGVLILEAFRPEQLNHASGGPRDANMLYSADDLRHDFAALDIRSLDETVVALDEGPFHQGLGAVIRLVAVKPA